MSDYVINRKCYEKYLKFEINFLFYNMLFLLLYVNEVNFFLFCSKLSLIDIEIMSYGNKERWLFYCLL